MTNREMLNAVISGTVTDEVVAKAEEMLAAMDKRNEKRSSKPSKTAIANEPIKAAILEFLVGKGVVIASVIGEGLTISTQKASNLCGQLVKDGKLGSTEVKVKGGRKVKGYFLVDADEVDEG